MHTKPTSEVDRRELYKAMRSAHDGICPLCGGNCTRLAGQSYVCVEDDCSFWLKTSEVEEIRSWHTDFHRNLDEVLDRWRMT